MKGLTYTNTASNVPGFTGNVHLSQKYGYAYETDTHFVHIYGSDSGFQAISPGVSVIQKKSGTLEDWVKRTFGAVDIQELKIEIGHSVDGVWRPSLYVYTETYQALNVSQVEMRLAEQSLRLLIEKLDELFLYIEPAAGCLDAYGHKTRELLILACTEVENSWKSYMDRALVKPINHKTFTTKDYAKLVDPLFLREYQFKLKAYKSLPPIRPFQNWDVSRPSSSLPWYDAYNKTKHDRTTYFSKATLWNSICAVSANLVMHCVKFSPIPMLEESNMFASLVQQHFDGELVDCAKNSFYIPEFEFLSNARSDLAAVNLSRSEFAKPFKVLPLTI